MKNINFLKKLEHRFLVESTKIKNAIFLYKTAWSVANVKAKRMGSAKFEKFVSVYEPLTKSWFGVLTTQISTFILFVSSKVLFEGAFACAHP